MPLDNTAEVETPEHVRFHYRVAGPVRRGLAYLIDLLVRTLLLLILGLVLALASGKSTSDLGEASQGLWLMALFLLEWGYFVVLETAGGGRSPGKRALSLRVVKEGGYPIGFLDSVLRNLLRAADFLPVGYVLGILVMAADGRFRRLGDRVAGTMVVIEERATVATPLALFPPLAPGELDALPGRILLSAAERESLELFLRRADLAPARRLELAQMIAPVFARRLGVQAADPVRFLALLHHRATASTRAAGA